MDLNQQLEFSQLVLVVGWLSLHVLGLVAAWATRFSLGPRGDLATIVTFLGTFCMLGWVAWTSQEPELGVSVPTSVTLMAMVVTAVIDFSPTSTPASLEAANSL